MTTEELVAIFDAAERAEKYVWLKHCFDRNPICGEFSFGENRTIRVGMYLSFIDGYEGLSQIDPEHVEWAHVSTQTTISAMRERLTEAGNSKTLVKLLFLDSIPPQLVRYDYYTTRGGDSVLLGYFVHQLSLTANPVRSRVPLKVLLDVQNTDIPSDAALPTEDFSTRYAHPNLCHFAEDAE
jgi:hypothetical protein